MLLVLLALYTLNDVQGSKTQYLFHAAPTKDALCYVMLSPSKKYFDFALSLFINFLEQIQVCCRLSYA